MTLKIKFIFFFVLFINHFFVIMAQINGCDFMFEANPQSTLVIDGNSLNNLTAGDTICLQGGLYYQLNIKNLHGTSESPIVIINKQGPVIINNNSNYGLTFGHCSNIKLTGSGTSGIEYGFVINHVENGSGLSINYLSTDFEIEHTEICNVAFSGIIAKTDPDCSFSAVRDSFELQKLNIHNNYIHNVGNEGMYIGNAHYTGIILNCNGMDTLIFPHLLSDINIHNNIVSHTGWDGIQVSSASFNCSVHDNNITFDSDSATINQMSGILVGGGSLCDCYNNIISDGKGDGIDYFGLGNNKIFNNLIINSGQTYNSENPKHGIYATDKYAPAGTSLYFYNNTIVSPKTSGIKFVNWGSSQNKAYNNLIINPGTVFFDIPYTLFDTLDNYYASNSSKILFDDTLNQNYDLQVSSPVINRGKDLSYAGITYDLLNRSRPFGNLFDIGAYECHKDGADITEYSASNNFFIKVSPNPIHKNGHVLIYLPQNSFVDLKIYDTSGKEIKKLLSSYLHQGINNMELKLEEFPSGLYYIKLETNNKFITEKILIIN